MKGLEKRGFNKLNIDIITHIPDSYPDEFNAFCEIHILKPPKITTGNGKALSIMLANKDTYCDRDFCDSFVKKFNIESKDSIQLFNKHSQWGIKTNSGIEKGRFYIEYPYQLSNKHKMRKNFKFSGSEEEKNTEIDKIKSTIKNDYNDSPNDLWQLGHKNPGSIDNTYTNLVLQPPIQGKYRDNYIFIDTLTKIPLPQKLKNMLQNKEIELTPQQIEDYYNLFNELKTK